MKNTALAQKKCDLVNLMDWKNEYKTHNFLFHGIPISFNTTSKSLYEELKNYIPKKWTTLEASTSSKTFHVIYHQSPLQYQNFSMEEFCDEESSLTYLYKEEFFIQRDFVAKKGPQQTMCLFSNRIDDGFHNFFRWFLSPLLISESMAMLHCAAILSHDNKVNIFLGPSGAGKTTITKLAKDRFVLSDDMNLLGLGEKGLWCSAGGVGGLYKPQVPISSRYEIKNIYWLTKDKEVKTVEQRKITQNQQILLSFANLPLGHINKGLE